MVFTNNDPTDPEKSYRDAFLGHVVDSDATLAVIEAARDGL